ncbi:hypothetical protein [Arthrobacter caoxuetaonis]|uniref:Uncharacterized protein n=1 Tax=Arthrobacter caoxuetaonis TaxID=2886935 RepID=A0A9X1SGG6_9MICC|nr:hypothetical protein [Arthrobacter caoxuetaonis]MCC3299354.1 hypothetical protein [Arthrobacter caoxuetaonis]USQ59153.1 hypothetical protein NF551_18780 [Arthrobacter caoxuetaonis]
MTTPEDSLTAAAEAASVQSRADEHAASLLDSGYTEVTEAGGFSVGQRVYHAGQRYPGAERGTAAIERIFVKAEGRGKGIEMIALRDDGTHGFWADYHANPAVTF